jgi:hypothetical protein
MEWLKSLIKKESTDVDRILEALQDEKGLSMLTSEDKERMHRLQQCKRWIHQYGSREKVLPMMINNEWLRADGSSYFIKERQAYRDYTDCQVIFSLGYVNEKAFWLDMLIGWVVETRKQAMLGDKKELAVAHKCEKLLEEIIMNHFGSKDEEAYKKINPVPTVIAFMPKELPVTLPDNWEEDLKNAIANKQRVKTKEISDGSEQAAF